jgi:hypothetical protein
MRSRHVSAVRIHGEANRNEQRLCRDAILTKEGRKYLREAGSNLKGVLPKSEVLEKKIVQEVAMIC